MIPTENDKEFIQQEPVKIAHNDIIQESPEITKSITPDKDEKGQEQKEPIKNSK